MIFPVTKNTDTFGEKEMDLPIGDRLNLCYASTVVTKGRGTGITIATGMNTQVTFTTFSLVDLKFMLPLDW